MRFMQKKERDFNNNKVNKFPRREYLIMVFIFILPFIAFWHYLAPDNSERIYFGGESAVVYTSFKFILQSLKSHQWPLWNPYDYLGMPFLATGSNMFLYFPNFLFYSLILLTRAISQLEYLMVCWMILHLSLAGIFMYLLTRYLKINPLGAMVSSIVFMFSGSMFYHFNDLFIIVTLTWFPLFLLIFIKTLDKDSYLYMILCGLIFGLILLAGYPQFALYSYLFLFFYLVYRNFSQKNISFLQRKKYFFFFILIAIIGFSLAAGQLLPGYELANLSIRKSMTYASSAFSKPLTPRHYIDYLIPFFFGGGFGKEGIPLYGGDHISYSYIGLLPLFLVAIAIACSFRNKMVKFFLFTAILFFLLSLGGHCFLYKIFWFIIPFFNKFRGSYKFLHYVDFSLAILAGFGVNSLIDRSLRKRKIIKGLLNMMRIFLILLVPTFLFLIVMLLHFYIRSPSDVKYSMYLNMLNRYSLFLFTALLVYFLISKFQNRFLFKSALIAIVTLDLLSFGLYYRSDYYSHPPKISSQKLYSNNDAIKFIKKDPGLFRVSLGTPHVQMPSIVEIQSLIGYQAFQLSATKAITGLLWSNDVSDRIKDKIINMLNVKYILIYSWKYPYDHPKSSGYELVFKDKGQNSDGCQYYIYDAPHNRRLRADEEIYLYLNKNYLPRYFYVNDVKLTNDKEALEIIKKGNIDFQETALVTYNLNKEEYLKKFETIKSKNENDRLELIKYDNNEILLKTSTSDNKFLVFSDPYYPGWKAYIDNDRVEIYKTNYAFRGIFVPKGVHSLKFVYQPFKFYLGLSLMVSCLLVCLSLGVSSIINSRNRSKIV